MDLQASTDREHRSLLRDYLLGRLESESDKRDVEERLLTDDAFFEELAFQEDELIEDYLDNELSQEEREAFDRHFLVSDERHEKLRFAKALSKRTSRTGTVSIPDKRPSFWSVLGSYLTPLPVAVAAVVVLAIGSVLWMTLRPPAADDALLALNKAYKSERPIEARVSSLDYAPFYKLRNNRESAVDVNEREQAEMLIRGRVSTNADDAASRHALGRLLLLKTQFDDAIRELEAAQKLKPADAGIQNDLGVAYLEKYKSESADRDKNARLPRLALEKFDKAIEHRPDILEAYFNRAECLEILNLPNEARAAWQKYIELDPSSQWAEEARERLKLLGAKVAPELSAPELEQAFIDAFRRRSESEAFALASQNRELIGEKYIPHRLAASFTDAVGPAREEKLAALEYLGRIESERAGDRFASKLGQFYKGLSEDKIVTVRQAQRALREGYRLCLEEDFKSAKKEFELSRELFLRAGDVIEADTIANYFIAYSIYYDDRAASARLLKDIGEFCERNGFRWFGLMNHYWWLGSQEWLGESSFTQTKLDYEEALRDAQDMGDAYMTQKFLQSLLIKAAFVKARSETVRYAHDLLAFSNRPGRSVRQRIRDLDKVIRFASDDGDASFSKALVLESVAAAATMTDPSFLMAAELNAGIVHTRTSDWQAAEEWLEKARVTAEALPEGATGKEDLATIYLHRGHLRKARGDLEAALGFYEKSLELAGGHKVTMPVYEAQKARLLTLQELGNYDQVEMQIAPTLGLTEGYRKTILDEQERNTFFDSEQQVYDVAVDLELRRGRDEKAYDFAELSSSRSLLDRLAGKATASESGSSDLFDQPTAPLSLNNIRAELPADVQLVHYRSLKDRLVVWLVSKDKFVTRYAPVAAGDLSEKVNAYLTLVQNKDPGAQADAKMLATELYNLLIGPVSGDLDPGKTICVIPNRILFYLPFSSLVSAADEKYLVENFAILYAPSANVFLQCTKSAATKSADRAESILSIGNPAFDRETFGRLQDLPESSVEAEAVTAAYTTSKTLSGRNATPGAFQSVYKDFDVIHFAGHYITEPNAPLSSKLIMARSAADTGVLTNGELMKAKLPRTKLVVLSACQTGVEGYYGGEGFVGLSRTFLAAGVPVVVASSWPVDSRSTSRLMQKFHSYRRQKLSTVRALRRAQVDMVNERGSSDSHPYAWAGFSVFGGSATF